LSLPPPILPSLENGTHDEEMNVWYDIETIVGEGANDLIYFRRYALKWQFIQCQTAIRQNWDWNFNMYFLQMLANASGSGKCEPG
jgi:hypothetical protein